MKVDTLKLKQGLIKVKKNGEWLELKIEERHIEAEISKLDQGDLDMIYEHSSKKLDFKQRFVKLGSEEYDLIEKPSQIKKRMEKTLQKTRSIAKFDGNDPTLAKFSRCIFLIEASFEGETFEFDADFKNSIFKEDSNFSRSIFKKEAIFTGSNFQKFVKFNGSQFKKEANFRETIFYKNADFIDAIFSEKTYFREAIFTKNVDFRYAHFMDNVSFRQVVFIQDVNFEYTVFEKFLSFGQVNTRKCDQFKLNLKSSQIQAIDYTDTNIEHAANRETFLILKNLALKQQDQIKALDFHVQEMEKYRQSLSWKNLNMWLLSFEKVVSYYGTQPVIPLICIIVLNLSMTFALIYFDYFCLEEFVKYFLHFLNPTSSIQKIFSDLDHLKYINFFEPLNSFKNILDIVLFYELVKSFRKFSRKL